MTSSFLDGDGAEPVGLGNETLIRPLVTVLTPVYNGRLFVEETIQSVLSQCYPRLEYIVLDDGSTDGTLELLEKFGSRIQVVSHPNMGETRTVNQGFTLARGEYVAVVNADDPLRPQAIELAVQVLERVPNAVLAYPDWVEIDPASKVLREFRLPQYDIRRMLRRFEISMGPGVLIRRRALEVAGVRDVTLKYTSDLDLWCRLALLGPFLHVPELLATHRVHPASASVSDQGSQMADELARLAYKCLDAPLLPEELRRERNAILGRVHFVASSYCGRDVRARIRHLVASLTLAPLVFSYLAARHLLHFGVVWMPKPMSDSLKRAFRLTDGASSPVIRWKTGRNGVGRSSSKTEGKVP